MKALVVTEPHRLVVEDIPLPSVGPYDALVRIDWCGICNSTDAKLIEGTMFWAPPFPIVLGHESVGTVVEVGDLVANFKVGDRVTRPVYAPPAGSGLHSAKGGFAEYGVVGDARARAADGDPSKLNDYDALRQLVLPAGLDSVHGALAISLAETASVLIHLPNLRDATVVVAGTGVTGLALTLWCKLAGARVITLGRRDERLAAAEELGADATVNTREAGFLDAIKAAAGGAVDGMIEATGDAALAGQLLGALKPDGFASAYGVPPTGVKYDPRWSVSQVEEHRSFSWVADLIERGWVKPEWFVTRTWSFDEVVGAFDEVHRGEVLKGFVAVSG